MAAQVGPQDPSLSAPPAGASMIELERRLRLEPYHFRFFQAVWLMERMRPQCAPVGEFSNPSNEVVHFAAYPSLAFPASDIQEMDWSGRVPVMSVNFMGLTGPSGVLPHVYTELIQGRGLAQDYALRDFLDILNHRLVSLFYRAWKRYRFPVDVRRFRQCLLSLTGLGLKALEERQTVADDSLLFYTGLLALQPRSAAALEQILEDYFQVPAEVEQFIGSWYRLDRASTCRFEGFEDASESLGLGAVIGDEVWDLHSRVLVKLGPLTMRQYQEFLPGRLGYQRLRDITRFFSRDELDFEVRLILRRQEVPACAIDTDQIQLGWTSWIKTRPQFSRDPGDAVLSLE